MRRMILSAALLAAMLVGLWGRPAHAGCTMQEVCQDVMDSASLTVIDGGGVEINSVTWSSDSENGNLSMYKVVRTDDPFDPNGTWVVVETVDPTGTCGTEEGYEVHEPAPEGEWTYAIQVYRAGVGLSCMIVIE